MEINWMTSKDYEEKRNFMPQNSILWKVMVNHFSRLFYKRIFCSFYCFWELVQSLLESMRKRFSKIFVSLILLHFSSKFTIFSNSIHIQNIQIDTLSHSIHIQNIQIDTLSHSIHMQNIPIDTLSHSIYFEKKIESDFFFKINFFLFQFH